MSIEKIETEHKYLTISENSILYFKKKFSDFDITKITIDLGELINFSIKFSYSIDNINWSYPRDKENFEFDLEFDIYLAIYFDIIIENDNDVKQLKDNSIKNKTISSIKINSIIYNEIILNILDDELFKLLSIKSIINKLPKWNFYDNQQLNIRRWLDQCIAISRMYGHNVIYFKTEPTETSHTFHNHVLRDVVLIKKIMIMSPNNELPQDRNVYSEWDMPMEGDFIIHIVDEIFKQAFGDNKVPLSKDYLYLPIINKLFRVSSVQPKNGFMGKIGWWEVFLTKYEDDESIEFSDELKDVFSGIENLELIDDVYNFLDDKLLSKENLQEKNIDEKKLVTNNFSNKLVDSTHYTSLKETDIQREFFSKRLKIDSINPDENAFPITMYNCSNIEKREIALTYNLKDLVSINKHVLLIDNFEFTYNFVLLGKFNGELFDLNYNEISLFTIELTRLRKIKLNFHKYQELFDINYQFEINEFYQIIFKYNHELKQLFFQIIMLSGGQKNVVFQNLYILRNENIIIDNTNKFEINRLILYGGSYLTNDLTYNVNNQKIMFDNVPSVLIMNQFEN